MHFSTPKEDSSSSPSADSKANESNEAKEAGGEEDVTEWKEGRDIVLERQPCAPGEDVQVEVLHGAAGSEGGHFEDVKEKCREVKREVEKAVGGRGHGLG